MKILNFGSCNVDYVYLMDHIVEPGETEATDSLSIFPGGKGLNQSIALARAGAAVYHAGCIGEDGKFLADTLARNSVDISYLKEVSAKNGHAIIQVSRQGENSIFLFPGSNVMIEKEDIDRVLSDFEAGDLILLQNEISNLEHIVMRAHERGMRIVLNPSPCSGAVSELDLSKISYLILNELEARTISGQADADGALAYFKAQHPALAVVLTLGSRGSIYQDRYNTVYQPSFKVKAVDTTAAGDTFTGYFVAGVASGIPLKETMRLASCAAGLAVARHGAEPSIPTLVEVQDALHRLETNKTANKIDKLADMITKYTEQHIGDLTLDRLAEALGYSTVYTGHLVKQIMGCSYKKYMCEKRLALAAELLKSTDLSIGEIFERLGYQNESYLRTKFKEKYGMKPLEYRKTYGG